VFQTQAADLPYICYIRNFLVARAKLSTDSTDALIKETHSIKKNSDSIVPYFPVQKRLCRIVPLEKRPRPIAKLNCDLAIGWGLFWNRTVQHSQFCTGNYGTNHMIHLVKTGRRTDEM